MKCDELSPDAAMREFIELATGRKLPSNHPITIADFSIPITQALIGRLAVLSLAGLAYRARRGSEKAQMYLVDRCLGTPQKPFKESVNDLDMDETLQWLAQELKGGLQINDRLAEDIVERLAKADLAAQKG
jgi:hypothetical protein